MGKMVSGRQRNWVPDASSQVREWYECGGVQCGHQIKSYYFWRAATVIFFSVVRI
jgi:hypothetical protein